MSRLKYILNYFLIKDLLQKKIYNRHFKILFSTEIVTITILRFPVLKVSLKKPCICDGNFSQHKVEITVNFIQVSALI